MLLIYTKARCILRYITSFSILSLFIKIGYIDKIYISKKGTVIRMKKFIGILLVVVFVIATLTACGDVQTSQVAETMIDGNYRYHDLNSPVRLNVGEPFSQNGIEICLRYVRNEASGIYMEIESKLDIENVRYTLTNPSNAEIVYNGSEGISMGRSGNSPYVISFTKSVFNKDLFEMGETTINPEWENYIIQFYITDAKGNRFLIPRTEIPKLQNG